MAADTRIQEEILAITDEGSVSVTDFEETSFERIPTENDDLSVSEYNEMIESGALAVAAIKKQINRECLEYARRTIDDCEEYSTDDDTINDSSSSTVTYSWKTTKEVPRMMKTAWTQSTNDNDIFNKYCPEVGLIWKRKAPAGCVCIALSQIIAFHEYPNLICNGLEIDYSEIKEIYSYDNMWNEGSETAKEMLARFCINVGGWCNIQYHSIFGCSYGFAWPWNAKSCLETFGYKNVSWNLGYDEDQVIETLDDDCPVFISAIAGFLQGHAWVIDGYIKRNYVSNKGTIKDTQTLVHCNWGWHGNCNGYFTSGVFRTQDAVSYDKSSGNTMDEKYFCAFNTITYDSPQK